MSWPILRLGQKSLKNLVRFLGDLKTPKFPSEIKWPLASCGVNFLIHLILCGEAYEALLIYGSCLSLLTHNKLISFMMEHFNPIVFTKYFYDFQLKTSLKVSKYRKQNTKFSHPPKNKRNFVHFFALASKKWLKQKINAFDDLN